LISELGFCGDPPGVSEVVNRDESSRLTIEITEVAEGFFSEIVFSL
jgi:hypothetical protein